MIKFKKNRLFFAFHENLLKEKEMIRISFNRYQSFARPSTFTISRLSFSGSI